MTVVCLSARSRYAGAACLQGLHHAALKFTNTCMFYIVFQPVNSRRRPPLIYQTTIEYIIYKLLIEMKHIGLLNSRFGHSCLLQKSTLPTSPWSSPGEHSPQQALLNPCCLHPRCLLRITVHYIWSDMMIIHKTVKLRINLRLSFLETWVQHCPMEDEQLNPG